MISPLKWHQLTIAEQLGNIGSEIVRARQWQDEKNSKLRNEALARALELLDLTISDNRWVKRRGELGNFREIVFDWFSDTHQYSFSPSALEEYCTALILVQRR